MDSFVLRWRAVWWGRVWGSVAVLTLAWSIGAGLALRAMLGGPEMHAHVAHPTTCPPGVVHPLVASGADLRALPLRAVIAAPLGLFASGLEFALLAFAIVLVPAALLQQGTARRVLSAPVIAVLAALLLAGGWDFQTEEAARTDALPTLACSN
jgi:hypothetical protein